jgi:hypothetical protein
MISQAYGRPHLNTNASSAPLQHWATLNTSLSERTPHAYALWLSSSADCQSAKTKIDLEEAHVSSILIN